MVSITWDELAELSKRADTEPGVAERMRRVLSEIDPLSAQIRGSLSRRDHLVRTYRIRVRAETAHGRKSPSGTAELLEALNRIDESQVLALVIDHAEWTAHIFITTDRQSLIGCVVGIPESAP